MDIILRRFYRYLKSERGYSPNTLSAYQRDLKQFRSFVEAASPDGLAALDPEALDGFVTSLQDMGYQPSTVARKVAATRAFLRFLYAEGVLGPELLDWLRQPKTNKRLPKTLSREQVDRLLQATTLDQTPLGLRDHALLEMLYATGMRASEITQVRTSDVDLEMSSVRCLGKGSKERVIPLYPGAVLKLRQYLDDGRPNLSAGRCGTHTLSEQARQTADTPGHLVPGSALHRGRRNHIQGDTAYAQAQLRHPLAGGWR